MSITSRLNLWVYRLIFGFLARRRPPRFAAPVLTSRSRVLLFSSAGLGDSLLDSVAIRALAETYPGIFLAAVVHHRRPDMSRHNPFLRQLFFLRKGPAAFLRLWGELRHAGPWDAVLYLSCHDPEARCLGFLLNRDATVGLAWRTEFGNLCARNLEEPGLRRAHLARQALRVAEELGARLETVKMVYALAEDDAAVLNQRLDELGYPPSPEVVFQLGGGGAPYRDWPVEHFVALARGLQAEGRGPVFLLGGPDHRDKASAFQRLAAAEGLTCFDCVGKLALPLSAALVARCRCLVSTDTGIMHLGFALGTPTVALLHCRPGAARVGPLADLDRHEVLELPKPPGYRSPSDASMSSLLPDEVLPRVLRVLQRAEGSLAS